MTSSHPVSSMTQRLSRLGYSSLWCVALPVVVGRVMWRASKNPRQLMRFKERFGYMTGYPNQSLWIHAASVGEVMAIVPLVKALKAQYPECPILVSTVTLTGADRVAEQLRGLAHHVFLPYDLSTFMAKAIKQINPRCLVLVETEIWPNLIHKAQGEEVPVVLVNARMSDKSAKGYAKLGGLIAPTLQNFSHIYAQFDADAQRLQALGADPSRLTVTGSIKFDVQVNQAQCQQFVTLREAWGARRPVYLLASTHDGEEALGLDIYQTLKQRFPDLVLVIAPRHPERFDTVAQLIEARGLAYVRRSQSLEQTTDGSNPKSLATLDVYLSDTLGELTALYACADVVLIGGSFNPVGGHNPLEPAYHGIAPVTGPNIHNFATVFGEMEQQGAAFVVEDASQATDTLERLLADEAHRAAAGREAKDYLNAHSGVLNKIVQALGVYCT